MRTKQFVLAITLLFITASAYSQKAKVAAAYNYLKYEELDKAKEEIDAAAIDEGSMNMDKTWYYRGLIYESISTSDKYKDLSPDALQIAYQSYKKALDIDPKSDFKSEIDSRMSVIKIAFFNKGVEAFNAKDFNTSLSDFENVLKITPDDSSANLYAAYSADHAKNTVKAEQHYQILVDRKQGDPSIYNTLAALYKADKDTARALSVLQEARKKYPDDLTIMLSEINIYLPMGKTTEALDLLNQAVAKDPKNASLYFVLGLTYDNLATPKDPSTIKPEDKKALLEKAKQYYLKTLEIKPDHFEANFNLGILYFNQAAEMLSKVDGIKDPKEYATAKANVEAAFGQSQPYLEKANELNPNDHDTLLSLKQLYFRENQMDKYYKVKAKLDAQGAK